MIIPLKLDNAKDFKTLTISKLVSLESIYYFTEVKEDLRFTVAYQRALGYCNTFGHATHLMKKSIKWF